MLLRNFISVTTWRMVIASGMTVESLSWNLNFDDVMSKTMYSLWIFPFSKENRPNRLFESDRAYAVWLHTAKTGPGYRKRRLTTRVVIQSDVPGEGLFSGGPVDSVYFALYASGVLT
jgi:hypothetical protein